MVRRANILTMATLLLACSQAYALVDIHSLPIEQQNGTIYTINTIKFGDNNITLHDSDNIVTSFDKNNLQSIIFLDNTTLSVHTTENQRVSIYPNPTADIITINGVDNNIEYQICDAEGRLVLKSHGTKVDMRNMPNGTYLMTIQNQTVKIIKR
ncbi:MAG TPA: hypothetical protein DEO38_00795 [Bacteroidales bacterium]|nr:hypothetical protein [Bacteroidales bacterium]